MKKILFLIHDLGQGGAEKVLVNLVNSMDRNQYDITVMTLFNHGEHRSDLKPWIKYKSWFPFMFRGNSHLMKLVTPELLHKWIIHEYYDIEISYLEGPSARVISGCKDPSVKLVSWIHTQILSEKVAAKSFRSIKEAKKCYNRYHMIACVSGTVRDAFYKTMRINVPSAVLYNTNECREIIEKASEKVFDISMTPVFNIICVGKLEENKGFDRVIRIGKKLKDSGSIFHIYILGEGTQRNDLVRCISKNDMEENVTLLGYQKNPYKYIVQCDLFVCSSYREGFSTAATEALILGVPVCTVEVSGMREMLGDSEYGLIVNNSEDDLYLGIKRLLDEPDLLEHYKKQAIIRGKKFKSEETVEAVQNLLLKMMQQ